MCSDCTMGYYLALKRNEVMVHIVTLMNVEDSRVKEARHKKAQNKLFFTDEMLNIGKYINREL